MDGRLVYAINKAGELMTAHAMNGQKWFSCPKCYRGVPVGHKCHGWHITYEKPNKRRVRIAVPE